jgi:hypothetical protein
MKGQALDPGRFAFKLGQHGKIKEVMTLSCIGIRRVSPRHLDRGAAQQRTELPVNQRGGGALWIGEERGEAFGVAGLIDDSIHDPEPRDGDHLAWTGTGTGTGTPFN